MRLTVTFLLVLTMVFCHVFEVQAQQHAQNYGKSRSHPASNIVFYGDWINSGTFLGNKGTAYFSGSSKQRIAGINSVDFQYIRVNNPKDIALEVPVWVTSEMYFQQGVVLTPRTTPSVFVAFADKAGYNNVADKRHVNGYCAKMGVDSFFFPIGSGANWRGAAISKPQEDDIFTAAYFQENPNNASLPAGAPFPVVNLDSALKKVSDVEYWDINGSQPVRITLTWDANSKIGDLTDFDLNKITVAGWNGSSWVNVGRVSINGSFVGGSVTSSRIVPDSFQVFTLAVVKDVPKCNSPVVDLGAPQSICPDSTVTLRVQAGFSRYLWADGSTDSILNVKKTGYYWVSTWDACGNEQTDTVFVNVRNDRPTIKTADATCFGRSDAKILLEGTNSTGIMNISLNGTPQLLPNLKRLQADTYRLTIQSPLFCSIDTNIILSQPLRNRIEIGKDTMSALFAQQFELTAKPMGDFKPMSWQWTPSQNMDCSNCQTTMARIIQLTGIEVIAMDSSGCMAADRIMVYLQEDSTKRSTEVYIPNTFKPEREGFTVFGTSKVVLVKRMQIFDRWGELIFEAKDFVPNGTVQWDGTFKGQHLNVASFVCVVECLLKDGTTDRKASDVLLIR